jgi:ElaB/YqjD/DUF883 family membrane-anchored ribosome-binding protein
MQQNITTDKLMQDLRVVVGDAEDLIKATAGQTGERVQQVRARAEESLRVARVRLEQAGTNAAERAVLAAHGVNDQVHEHPWGTAAIAGAVGLALGILIGRK